MANYFNFQNEAMNVLLGSEVSRYLSTTSTRWLFTDNVLGLNQTSPIDTLAKNLLWTAKSFASTAITSTVLLLMSSASVIESNVEWLSILFKDEPIVRDYKAMLDIEVGLYDVAFSRSKQMDLTRSFQSDLLKNFNELIKKYQELWLFETWAQVKWGETMADILLDLVNMNTSMKHFISWWSNYWNRVLRSYNWCLWNLDEKSCNRDTSTLKFSDKAIEELVKDYKDVRSFWECNLYANAFRSTVEKTINNNSEYVKTAVKDMKKSIERLKVALIWKWRWNFHNDPCKEISDYEMAQLQSYWWWDWVCWKWITVSTAYLKAKDYFNNKKAQKEQVEKLLNMLKFAEKPASKKTIIGDPVDKIKKKRTSVEREQEWFKIFGNDTNYNSDFLFDMNSWFNSVYETTIVELFQDQEDAMSADVSSILPRAKWVLEQQDAALRETRRLNGHLQEIADYQAANVF